jgi:hypothetical protein
MTHVYFCTLPFLALKIWTNSFLCEKRKETEGIFVRLRTTFDHEPAVYVVSIRTLFSKLRELSLSSDVDKNLNVMVCYAAKIAILEVTIVINFEEVTKLPIYLSVCFMYTLKGNFRIIPSSVLS